MQMANAGLNQDLGALCVGGGGRARRGSAQDTLGKEAERQKGGEKEAQSDNCLPGLGLGVGRGGLGERLCT